MWSKTKRIFEAVMLHEAIGKAPLNNAQSFRSCNWQGCKGSAPEDATLLLEVDRVIALSKPVTEQQEIHGLICGPVLERCPLRQCRAEYSDGDCRHKPWLPHAIAWPDHRCKQRKLASGNSLKWQ